jgi:hypothetical protein
MELQFSGPRQTPATPLSPWLPPNMNYALQVTVRAALDRDKATSTETFILTPDTGSTDAPTVFQHTFPQRYQAAHQLGISVAMVGSGSDVVGVQASIVEVTRARDAYGSTPTMTTFAQSAGSALFLPANSLRRQFIIQNLADVPLYIAFDESANVPPTSNPRPFTFALPNQFDIYESPVDAYQGPIAGVWTLDGTGFAAVTEGA